MKSLSLAILILYAVQTQASNYYFSSLSGNDSRTAALAQNAATPWKTLSKLNAFFINLKPGDSVLFKRNESFYGQLVISGSGSSSKSIIIAAYGTGAKPVITGLTTISSWINLGKNIWESNSAVSTLSTCNMVVKSGVNTAMGRYPNNGYLTYQSHNGDNSITSNNFKGSTNWTGAELVLRKNHYIIDRGKITAHSGGTLSHNTTSTYDAVNGYGFFIQNDSRTLDTLNEWYYNPSTKKLRIYSVGSPTNVQLSTVDTLVYVFYKNFLTFDNIEFRGSNTSTLYSYLCNNVSIQNCSFNFSGSNALSAYLSTYFNIVKSVFNNTNNNAMTITSWDYLPAPTHHIMVSEDTIRNTAVLAGMGRMLDEQSERCAIFLVGSNNTIQKCLIDSTGYIPVWWAGNSALIKNNVITNFCFIKDDGGAIWTWNNGNIPIVFTNQKVLNNIILNGIGALAGSVPDIFSSASGIYCDCNAANIEITGNTVANCNRNGILIHDAHEISVRNNTLFNNGFQITLFSDNDFTNDLDKVSLIRNMIVKGNICLSKTSGQQALATVTYKNDVRQFGSIDSNYYARPVDDNLTVEAVNSVPSWKESFYSLSGWRSYSGFDAHSGKSPKVITNINDLRFEYNGTASSKTISLDANYIDVTGKSYSKNITLASYSSIILIKSTSVTTNEILSPALNTLQLQKNSNVVYQNAPNPFNSITTIHYETADKEPVKIIVYNVANQQVAVLVNEVKEPGSYQVQWNAGDILAGNYFYTVTIGNSVTTRKMLKLK